jgi:hypothetical protein
MVECVRKAGAEHYDVTTWIIDPDIRNFGGHLEKADMIRLAVLARICATICS